MRFMMIVKATPESETGRLPTTEELTEMGRYNEELVKAGILLAGEGLHSSSKGVRVTFSKTGTTVKDGPFSETKELIAGFWIIEVKSREEAVAWARRIPFQDGEVEIRQVASAEDFAPSDPTGELRAREEELRAQVEAKARA
ncbi:MULTISPECIES: YciI family protein [Corallococcus]|uniref:DGPF domain-containing protein n=1 Tax=Corallococcus coralloides TaxID=184914 RepID=A0A410RTT1_CORCK|nr:MULTISPECIES: YciI family protein [Corallococcus]MBN9685069.1 YciI family protein [Corallococcus sp. NCSPR001]QAT85319.1 DGPF domain-containing protein [Corallococcus coralloides]WAS83472.1 YciI family protein [Corallococcus sp. NCRR]